MTAKRTLHLAALVALLIPALTIRPGQLAMQAHAHPLSDQQTANSLSTVALEARLPDTGHVRFVRVSPDGTVLFVGLANGALERSADSGNTWQDLPRGTPGGPGMQTLDLQISQSNPNVVWSVGLTGVYRSTDSGRTWNEADARSDGSGRAVGSIIALDPRHPEAAYVAGYRNGGLYRTSDAGQSWQMAISYPVSGVAVDPGSGAIIYAVSRTAGLQRSTDHAVSFSKGVSLPRYAGIGEATAQPGRLMDIKGPGAGVYVAMDEGGLERTLDNGQTWQDISEGLPQPTANPVLGSGFSVPYNLISTGGSKPQLYLVIPASPLGAPGTGGTLYTALTTSTAITWHQVSAHVGAIAPMPGVDADPAVAAEAPSSSGLAATVATASGKILYKVRYRLPPAIARVSGSGFAYGAQQIPYLYGVNYEGPNDRPWQMWQENKFDATLIARDLDAAAATGYKVLRVFVQNPLPQEILNGQYGHLDTLWTLARQRDLQLLITFNDSRDPDLGRVAKVDGLVAAHLAGNPTIFGYDVQNEPGFQDIVSASYPAGTEIPLQSADVIARYGEHVSLAQVRSQRAAGKWQAAPFDHMTVQQVYTYLNVASILDDFFTANPSYPATPAAAKWNNLLTAANQSLATYLKVQMSAIHAVDRDHLITLGYNNNFWFSMPANEVLDFRSIHLYPTTQDFGSIHGDLRYFEGLRENFNSPLVLEEYGFSTAFQSGSVASVQETAMSLYLRVLGGAGDFKWVLNDDTVGYNATENGLGLFGANGVPKSGYYINREQAAYFNAPHEPGGVRMWDDSTTGIGYLYAAPDALGFSGSSYSDTRLSYAAYNHVASSQLWLDWAQHGSVRLVSTREADLTLDLGALTGAVSGTVSLSPVQPFTQDGLKLSIHLQPGVWYRIGFTPSATVPAPPADLPVAAQQQGWYILASGHNVMSPFLKSWLALGGTTGAGIPLAEASTSGGGSTQYYTNLALQTSGKAVTLLPLGLEALGGQATAAAKELPKSKPHLYFAATGHNLRAAFLQYWRANGGEAVWGLPVSEEQVQGKSIVQYFANAEFVWDGASVILAPLGERTWARLHG